MLNTVIKEKIEKNNELIEKAINAHQFTLNKEVLELLEENERLREQCTHEFKDGYCIYCYKGEEK